MSEQQGLENSWGQQPSADEASADMRRALLDAGKTEFANFGYDGARLERIAAKAGCAKRMLYYYFGNKKDVYLAVIEQSYSDIRESEEQLNLDALEPLQALHALAQKSFEYHEQNQEFTRLVLQENFQGGEMLGQISKTELLRKAALEPIERIVQRGVAQGLFKDQLNAVDVHYLISALSGFRVDHAATWHSLLQVDLLGDNLRARHLQLLLAQLSALVCKERG
ncbi:TetR/AcrR family transcriptional regulator [Comamonas testosteroni]|uniref:TetR/AcrR family transcriptional regulator n=1 Tax=Comamonas testosteroni TaxID=285 RepID=UPI00265EEF2A|nr:TetR/AcrR family transcriptional regulator [Comamonas testosteroni]WKL17145.1 TetR/AcrR family transcriptional regulator [Comamonas testosteroni]WQD44347.1 TetR/AcrR family transcriptional regulator [Comamonas testosteroni]